MKLSKGRRRGTMSKALFFFKFHLRARWGTEPYVALHNTLYISLSCSFTLLLSLPLQLKVKALYGTA